jgi:hypothetical protein
VQPPLRINHPHLGWSYKLFVHNTNLRQRAIQIPAPKIQEFDKSRKPRGKIIFLPDVALKQVTVIGHPVGNFGGGQAPAEKLALQIILKHLLVLSKWGNHTLLKF